MLKHVPIEPYLDWAFLCLQGFGGGGGYLGCGDICPRPIAPKQLDVFQLNGKTEYTLHFC